MTELIIIANIIVFILIRNKKLYVDDLDSSYLCVFVRKQYYRLITSGFTHFELSHLVCNMYSLYSIGSTMEYYYGSIRFLLVYLIILASGGAVALLSRHNGRDDYTCSVGASGAICGLIGAYFIKIFLFYGMSSIFSIVNSLVPMIIMSFMPGVDYRGHLYGFLIGGIIGFII